MIINRAAFTLVAALASITLAQEAPPPTDQPPPPTDPAITRPIDESRRYRNQRDESLSEHERFDRSNIPPGYTVHSWQREMAATEAYDRGYEDGFEEGFRASQRNAAQSRTEKLYDAALAQGVDRFRAGEYGAALRNFILAAKSDQGDPASRLHAAHAMTALQHYDDAFLLIRRAFQLQPQLAFIPLDVREYYAGRAEFEKQISRLRADAAAADNDAKRWLLLGYFEFFSGKHARAHDAIKRAATLAPDDSFIRDFLDAARLSVPASGNRDAH